MSEDKLAKSTRKSTPTKPSPLVVQSLAAVEAEIGGRDALVAALAHAPKSRDILYILGLIGDPRSATTPLADLCARGGITPGELIDAYKSGEINRAQALATSKVGHHLAAVAEDTMLRSLPQQATCPICQGLGQYQPEPTKKVPNPDPVACQTCQSSGVIVVPGDLEHKKLALDMGKLLQKGGGISLAVNQQVGLVFGTAGGALEKLQAATDQILYGEAEGGQPVVEAEVEEIMADVEGPEESQSPRSAARPSPARVDPDTPIIEPDWRADLDASPGGP